MITVNDINKNKKTRLILGILILLFVVLGSCGFLYYRLPYKLIPFQIPFIPKDSFLISETLHKEMPGYSQAEVISAEGNNQYNDPRLISVRVKLDTGETPVICEGQIFSWIGDPGNRGIRWQTLECEELATSSDIHIARSQQPMSQISFGLRRSTNALMIKLHLFYSTGQNKTEQLWIASDGR